MRKKWRGKASIGGLPIFPTGSKLVYISIEKQRIFYG